MLGHWRGLHNHQFFLICFKILKKQYFVEVIKTVDITPYYYHYICLYISYDAVVQRLYLCPQSKNMLTHTYYSKNGLTHTFYFRGLFFDITPIDLQTLIFYSYKVLSCSFIYVYWNEAIKTIKKTELQL